MPRIPGDELERLKRETDLAALVRSRGVELKARGNDLVGRCPFHGPDEEPSFVVTAAKGLFHCFGFQLKRRASNGSAWLQLTGSGMQPAARAQLPCPATGLSSQCPMMVLPVSLKPEWPGEVQRHTSRAADGSRASARAHTWRMVQNIEPLLQIVDGGGAVMRSSCALVILMTLAGCVSQPVCENQQIEGLFDLDGLPKRADLVALLLDYAAASCSCHYENIAHRVTDGIGQAPIEDYPCLGQLRYDGVFGFDPSEPTILEIELTPLRNPDTTGAVWHITAVFDGRMWLMYPPTTQ